MALLGFTAKAKEGKLTADEQKQIFAKYEETYGTTFTADKEANEDLPPETSETQLSAKEIAEIAAFMGVEETEVPDNAKEAAQAAAKKVATEKAAKEAAEKKVDILGDQEDKGKKETVKVENKAVALIGHAHTTTHLFGVKEEFFLLSHPENKLMASRELFVGAMNKKQRTDFIARVEQYAEKVGERIEHLRKNDLLGALDFNAQIKGESRIDYTDLFNTAGEFIVRRTDLILAYLRTLPTVRNIFPMLTGVQNKMKAPTANFSELSQGYRKGRIFKGNVRFNAETYKVDDLMFKYDFEDLIELERQYIGYLNKEGSSVFKWTFIEWIMVHFGTKLQNEQNVRNVRGVAVPEQDVISNPANFGADGALRAIERAIEERKVLPFGDFGVYDANSMLDTVEGMYDKLYEVVPDTSNFRIYMNDRHQRWYIREYRQKYGTDADFTGSKAQLVDLSPEKIIWVPNMQINDFRIWITIAGNVTLLEDKPSEMLSFLFSKEYESVLVLSRWKEGAIVEMPGIQFNTQAALEANNFEEQWLFVNKPTTALELTADVDFSPNTHFAIKNATGGAAAVDTVKGAAWDVVYKLEADAVGAKVIKGGAFSEIKSDFTAVAKGDYIKVYAQLADVDVVIDGETVKRTQMTGKFLELERSVTVTP